MPDLGNRSNVMGPQPLAKPVAPPAEVEATAIKIAELIATGKTAEVKASAIDAAQGEMEAMATDAKAGKWRKAEIVGLARVNAHYFVKVRMAAENGGAPFLFQLRVGEREGRWIVWDAMNLSGKRSAWTR